jgi:hypothetical protein
MEIDDAVHTLNMLNYYEQLERYYYRFDIYQTLPEGMNASRKINEILHSNVKINFPLA